MGCARHGFKCKGVSHSPASALQNFLAEVAHVQVVCSSASSVILCVLYLVHSSHDMVRGKVTLMGADVIYIAAESCFWLAGCIFDLHTLILILLHYCHCSVTVTAPLLSYCHCSITVILSLLHYCHTVTAPLLSYCHCSITVILSLLHY